MAAFNSTKGWVLIAALKDGFRVTETSTQHACMHAAAPAHPRYCTGLVLLLLLMELFFESIKGLTEKALAVPVLCCVSLFELLGAVGAPMCRQPPWSRQV